MIPACSRIVVAARLLDNSHPALASRCGAEGACRIWDGARSKGGKRPSSGFYGSVRVPGVKGGGVRAHVAAAWVAGLIVAPRLPAGLHIDHLCRRSLCINPDHFEIVPAAENIRRRWRRAPADSG